MVVFEKMKNKIWIIDMACPLEKNVETKEKEKRQKYQQLAGEMKSLFPGYDVEVIAMVVGCLSGVNNLQGNVQRILECTEKTARRTATEMQRATIMGSAAVWRRVTT